VKQVLFVCTHDAGRSQMAMREVGIELTGKRPNKLLPEMQLHADWAVTLACGATCPFVPATVEDWDIPDPAGRSLDEVRRIRDQVEVRVQDLIEHRLRELPVRSFVMTIAERKARNCLAAGTCVLPA
jgi:protein-tyrosine-phosphatase